MKYTSHPESGETTILEEDHYYPYGLKHNGYDPNHQFVGVSHIGDIITLMDVTPFLGDSYKYKFGGMEYSDEFDINTYDFGARNYDPALGRWMNMDPLAELMRRHSPYNYAFNNPVFFIDPDGMMPGGFANIDPVTSTGSMEVIGGFDVNTVDNDGNVLDTQYHANVNGANNAASGIGASIESSGSGTSDAISGSGCPDGDCGGEKNDKGESLQVDTNIEVIGGAGALEYIAGGGIVKGISLLKNPKVASLIKGLFGGGKAVKTGVNLIPEGNLANHLFKGAGKLADNPANRTLIQNMSNGKALVTDQFGKSWCRGLDGTGKAIYSYTQNGIVKGAGYTNLSAAEMIVKYGVK